MLANWDYFSSNSSHTKSREYQRMRQGRPVGVMHPSWMDQCRVFESFSDCTFLQSKTSAGASINAEQSHYAERYFGLQ